MKISNKIANLEQGKSCPQLKWICLLEEGILALDDWKVFNLVRQLEDTYFSRWMYDLGRFANQNQFSQSEMEVSRFHFILHGLGQVYESLYFLLYSSAAQWLVEEF